MYDAAITIINEYIDKYLFSPSFSWPKYEFKKRSYQQWAAYEICDRIMNHPFEDSITVIENFMLEMSMYACYGKDKYRNVIFQFAAETAEDVIKYVNEKEKNNGQTKFNQHCQKRTDGDEKT